MPEIRQLDRDIATKVMGIQLQDSTWADIPHYSTDIAAAWRIVGHFDGEVTLHGPGAMVGHGETANGDSWMVEVGWERDAYGYGETAPLAICHAALKAVSLSGVTMGEPDLAEATSGYVINQLHHEEQVIDPDSEISGYAINQVMNPKTLRLQTDAAEVFIRADIALLEKIIRERMGQTS